MVCELARVLVEEAVAGIRVDPQLCVGQVVGEKVAVLGDHHRVVVPVRDQRRLRDRAEPVELRRLRDPPARDRVELRVTRREVRRLVGIDRPREMSPRNSMPLARPSSEEEKNSRMKPPGSNESGVASA
jgi:hypothetical protein